MKAWSAALLGFVLCVSVLAAWVPARWPAGILEIAAFGLAAAWAVRLQAVAAAKWNPLLMPVSALAGWAAIQLAFHWTLDQPETARFAIGWAANAAILFVALQIFDDTLVRERFLRALLWFAFLICLIAVPQSLTASGSVFWVFPIPDPPPGIMGPFLYRTHFANFIELALPLVLIPAMEHPRKRLWYAFMAAAMIASVILSASRGGFAIVTVETALVCAVHVRRRQTTFRETIPAIVLTLAATATLASMVGWNTLMERWMNENPYADRLQLLRSSIPMLRDHLWTGVGFGAWPAVYPHYARFDMGVFVNQAHNDWAQAAAEGGIVGLAMFAWMFVWVVRQSTRNVWAIGAVAVFVHAMFDYPFHKPQIAAMVFLAMAAAASASPRRRQNRREFRREGRLYTMASRI